MKEVLDKLIREETPIGSADGVQLAINGQPVAGALKHSQDFPGLYEIHGSGAFADRSGNMRQEADITIVFPAEAAAVSTIVPRQIVRPSSR